MRSVNFQNPSSPDAQDYAIQRAQALAQALQQQAFKPIENSDAPLSWTQGLQKILEGYLSGKQAGQVKKLLNTKEQGIQGAIQSKINDLAPQAPTTLESIPGNEPPPLLKDPNAGPTPDASPATQLSTGLMQANAVPGGPMVPAYSDKGKQLASALQGLPSESALAALSSRQLDRAMPAPLGVKEVAPGGKIVNLDTGQTLASNPKENLATTEIGKLHEDLLAGRISRSEFDKKMVLETTRAPNATLTMLNDPTVQAGMQARARLIANYEAPPPSGFGANNPATAKLWSLVTDLNDHYDTKEFDSRQAGVKRWAGINADRLETLNTATQHLAVLKDTMAALDNNDPQAINAIGNFFSVQMGKDPVTNFRIVSDIVGKEVAKMTLGGLITNDDKQALNKEMPESGSPSQLLGALNKLSQLAGGRVGSMRLNYKAVTGYDDPQFDRRLSPASKAFESQYGTGSGTSTGVLPTAPITKTIGDVTYVKRGNQWFPQ